MLLAGREVAGASERLSSQLCHKDNGAVSDKAIQAATWVKHARYSFHQILIYAYLVFPLKVTPVPVRLVADA